jgi:hypothetical protein
MPTEKLLKALPILQKQLDALLEFEVSGYFFFYLSVRRILQSKKFRIKN